MLRAAMERLAPGILSARTPWPWGNPGGCLCWVRRVCIVGCVLSVVSSICVACPCPNDAPACDDSDRSRELAHSLSEFVALRGVDGNDHGNDHETRAFGFERGFQGPAGLRAVFTAISVPAKGVGKSHEVGVPEGQIRVFSELVELLPGDQPAGVVLPDDDRDVGVAPLGSSHFLNIHEN